MREQGLQAYIIPGTDPHASEYMADHWKEITFISGFKGETGTVLVTLNEAFLWTDSRYYLQANKELVGTGVSLMRESDIDTPTIPQWLCANLQSSDTVGVNPEMFTVRGYNNLAGELSAAGIGLKSVDLPFRKCLFMNIRLNLQVRLPKANLPAFVRNLRNAKRIPWSSLLSMR